MSCIYYIKYIVMVQTFVVSPVEKNHDSVTQKSRKGT